jgi:2-keto-4-pentenoate hydratase/2-oxohepta-3-ene-1,7-dioic acid hydratase in catechol pathway
MRFLTFIENGAHQLGLALDDAQIVNVTAAWTPATDVPAPTSIDDVLPMGAAGLEAIDALRMHAGQRHMRRLAEIEFAPPLVKLRRNVFCVGRNYREHIIEGNRARGRDPNDFPKAAEFFTKPPSTLCAHRGDVKRHHGITEMLDYEVELGVVIGTRGTNLSAEEAMRHVFGYTIINDISARDLQLRHGQWFKGKSLDTSCPAGPFIVHKSAIPDPHTLDIGLSVNGEIRQNAHTSDLLFSIGEIIHQLSQGMTLEAGDIIATGTPSGVGMALTPPRYLEEGDVMKAYITGLGELVNTVKA